MYCTYLLKIRQTKLSKQVRKNKKNTKKNNKKAIFSKTITVPEFPVLEIEHDYAFNVNPTNFLGFSNYLFHTNAPKTKIYAVFLGSGMKCVRSALLFIEKRQSSGL